MEVLIPGQNNMDFDINTPKSPGLFAAPSSPTHNEDYYFSAPATPRQISQFYREFDEFLIKNSMEEVRRSSVSSSVPFDWEEKPGTPKALNVNEDEFAFDVSQEIETLSLTADELFDGGKIRPLKPPPSRQKTPERERGRERSVSSLSSSRSIHRATRSLSPLRVSEYPWEECYNIHQQPHPSTNIKPALTQSTSTLSSTSLKGYKKWRLKDLFLFRSASEGRATDKYPIKKYASLFKKHDDLKSSSFRSIDSPISSSKRRGPISAHEMHYTMNRAVSEDLKKKTFLPYKQGILGRLAFNPAVHAIANGFGLSRK